LFLLRHVIRQTKKFSLLMSFYLSQNFSLIP
jgi:hypothetical protein